MPQNENISSLNDPNVRAVLERLHSRAKADGLKAALKIGPTMVLERIFGKKSSPKVEYHKLEDIAIPITREQGVFSYLVARSISASRIVEFGTSFGVSTIYLAAAVRDNGGGIVIGSEFVETKAAKAQANLEEAGLSAYVEIRPGDALQTLRNPGGNVDMVLMDGAKELYMPIIKMLKPHIRQGAIVLADNVSTFFMKKALASYVEFMQDPINGFQSVTLPFPDGFEYSLRL